MDAILKFYDDLKKVRLYLIKLGPKRRSGKILENKLNEVDVIYDQYETWLIDFKEKIKKKFYSAQDIELIENYCRQFIDLREDILLLCESDIIETSTKMNSFDLKTALTLLPIMTNEETSIKQLIDNIEYYNSLLKDSACKQNLINFVLKSRLTQEAKIKLNAKYDTVKDLIDDMKNVLLSKKAATAIQNKLMKIKQNELSIVDYGKEITELFVDLTITQANDNEQNFTILKPINEKIAIKQFADGLRNRRLSTIISARNYSSLKDAVQAAQDEEVSTTTPHGEIMGMYKRPLNNFYYNRSRSNNYRGQRGGGRNFYANRGQARGQQQRYRPTSRGQPARGGTSSHRWQRGNFTYSNRRNQGIPKERDVNVLNNSEQNTESGLTFNQFFRD